MNDILVLARLRVSEFDLAIMADYHSRVHTTLESLEGFHGLSVWRDPRDRDSFLVVYDYADNVAAERGLVAVAEARSVAKSQNSEFLPADVIRVRVLGHSGIRIHEVPATAFLSMSVRISDPGYGPELVADIERTFDELKLFEGYVGSVIGVNDTLEEEVIGIVTWSSREAFQASIPPTKSATQLTAFSRFY